MAPLTAKAVLFAALALFSTLATANPLAELAKPTKCNCYTATAYYMGTVCASPTNSHGKTCAFDGCVKSTTAYIPPHNTACPTTYTTTLEPSFCPSFCPVCYTTTNYRTACYTETETRVKHCTIACPELPTGVATVYKTVPPKDVCGCPTKTPTTTVSGTCTCPTRSTKTVTVTNS